VRARLCNCGHDKRDHALVAASTIGACKVCLCRAYEHAEIARAKGPEEESLLTSFPKLSRDRADAL
jgi:hypothetical protein